MPFEPPVTSTDLPFRPRSIESLSARLGARLPAEVLVEELRDLAEGFPRFGRAYVPVVVRMRLAFVDLQHRFDPRLTQLAMHPHSTAQQQVAGSGGENRRRKVLHVAVDRRKHRV